MKRLSLAILLSLLATSAYAQTSSCKAQADEKKLHGAAFTSNVKKCCETAAKAQKLSGAAYNSNVKKCVQDAGTG
jgi:hypothetical protein